MEEPANDAAIPPQKKLPELQTEAITPVKNGTEPEILVSQTPRDAAAEFPAAKRIRPMERPQTLSQPERKESLNKQEIDAQDMDSVTVIPQIKTRSMQIPQQAGNPPAMDKGTIKPREEYPAPRSQGQPGIQPSAPTIRVSIGRIEVRAIMPPVAPRKVSPPSQPRMSLEDYLRQRDGGRR